MVLVAFLVNVIVAWGICLSSNRILKLMGRGGLRAVSRIFSLLLAAIAVSMILKGLSMVGLATVMP